MVTAVSRAQGILDSAWRVVGDPVRRKGYDDAIGLRRRGGGLAQSESFPSEPAWRSSDFDFAAGRPGAELLAGLMVLTDWLTPHPREPRRITVPDIRGLFYSACLDIAANLHLRVTAVRVTEYPMPVDGLVVDQSPSRQRRCTGTVRSPLRYGIRPSRRGHTMSHSWITDPNTTASDDRRDVCELTHISCSGWGRAARSGGHEASRVSAMLVAQARMSSQLRKSPSWTRVAAAMAR